MMVGMNQFTQTKEYDRDVTSHRYYSIYTFINKIIQEFKIVIKKGIPLNNRKLGNTILYANDHILMATSEDELQTMAYHLNLIARKYKMTISSTKTKSMAVLGNHIQRVKMVINDNIIEQVTDFKYMGYRISE